MNTFEWMSPIPALAGLGGVLVMTFFLRRARFFNLPETQMVRAIGSIITKNVETALMPGTVIHVIAGVVFAYIYTLLLSTAPDVDRKMVVIIICTMFGVVHGLIVTLFLVISVAQYHPIEQFRKLDPSDKAAHVIGHMAYGLTVGLVLAYTQL